MKAVGYRQSLPISDPQSLCDIEVPKPVPGPRDLLVEIKAIAVNPVDTKVRKRAAPPPGEVRILGWDATGVVAAVGSEVRGFSPGEYVFYAGALARQGCNAEFQVVDERLVGHAPRTLPWAEAAALPLTSVTAWEMLFDRMKITPEAKGALLIIGGAGGVGSIMIQLAGKRTRLNVVATASRAETEAWCRSLGVHHVIDHTKLFRPQLEALGLQYVEYIAALTNTDQHLDAIADVIAPQGRFAVIDDPPAFDILRFKAKSVAIHWELMFTRSTFQTPDMDAQGKILEQVSAMVDKSEIRTTLGQHMGKINAENLRKAHALLESGKAKGKLVLEGF
jgi:NADPH:quinone reductase